MVERISAWQRSVRRKRRTRRGCRTMPFRERCRERAGPGRDVPWPLPAALALQKCYHAETRGPCIHAPSLRRVDDCRTGIVHPARWPDSLPMSRPRRARFRPARRMAILRRCAPIARDALAPLRARARRPAGEPRPRLASIIPRAPRARTAVAIPRRCEARTLPMRA